MLTAVTPSLSNPANRSTEEGVFSPYEDKNIAKKKRIEISFRRISSLSFIGLETLCCIVNNLCFRLAGSFGGSFLHFLLFFLD
jgi:hypothetical protein